jgi:sugar phosphate isomerase/epimerase
MSSTTSNSSPAKTRTGGFPIGFRRTGSEWQKDLKSLITWARENRFGVIDIGSDGDQTATVAVQNGIRLGSVDLKVWHKMLSPDKSVRDQAVATNAAYIRACAAAGPINYFTLMLPEKPELSRAENFGYMVESFRQLTPVLEASNAKIVIEGWPGPGALCCTPEGYEAFFKECPSKAFGVNFDPSHLIRMGIDPLRFLREFGSRVYHVHGKDTEILSEGLYRYGNTQEGTFGKSRAFGGLHWRYTIPGHGIAPWVEMFRLLVDAGYKGAVSIELEDENFIGGPDNEKAGFLRSRDILESF